MPIGDFVTTIPNTVFILVHVVALLVGLYGAYWANGKKQDLWMAVFGLWALSELVYLITHATGAINALFAHTLQEVLLLVAFLYVVYKASSK